MEIPPIEASEGTLAAISGKSETLFAPRIRLDIEALNLFMYIMRNNEALDRLSALMYTLSDSNSNKHEVGNRKRKN